jgi:hypothetical protein
MLKGDHFAKTGSGQTGETQERERERERERESRFLVDADHPCADIAHGERLDKDIYEALRAGPAWNKTLFLIIWDDIGE